MLNRRFLNISAQAPSVLDVQYLVIAGGGSASSGVYNGQGGGAGGYLTGTLSVALSTNYEASIGAGGASVTNQAGVQGGNSTFASITSDGGGAGGSGTSSTGGSGGSGGAGSVAGGSASTGQGYNGGVGDGINGWVAGAGGGAGAIGGSISGGGTDWVAGTGGIGATPTIITAAQATTLGIGEVVSSTLYFAGGGGGGGYNYPGYTFTPGAGGNGGGGDGSNSTSGGNGSNYTGGGGGGGNMRPDIASGAGGSGVVLLKYPSIYNLNINGHTIQTITDGGNKITAIKGGSGDVYFTQN